jgi:hypothetical protein
MNRAEKIRAGVWSLFGLGIVALIWTAIENTEIWWLWLGLATVVAGLAVLVRVHAGRTLYRCPSCGHVFAITAMVDFASPHYPFSKYLDCPSCGSCSWCPEVDGKREQ